MTTTAVPAVQQENEHTPWDVQGSSSEFALAAHFYDALGQRYEFAFTGGDYVGVALFNFRLSEVNFADVDKPERYGAYPTSEAEAIEWVKAFMGPLKASHEVVGLPTTSEDAADMFAQHAEEGAA